MELSLWKINSIIIVFVSSVKSKECPMKDKTCLSGDNLIEMKRTQGLVACSKYNNNCDASIYLSILKMMHVKKLQTPSVSFGLLFQQETSVSL